MDNSKIPYVFTGQLNYALKKMKTMQRAGYRVIKQHVHPNNLVTISMEKKLY
jgi:hypothetical protein